MCFFSCFSWYSTSTQPQGWSIGSGWSELWKCSWVSPRSRETLGNDLWAAEDKPALLATFQMEHWSDTRLVPEVVGGKRRMLVFSYGQVKNIWKWAALFWIFHDLSLCLSLFKNHSAYLAHGPYSNKLWWWLLGRWTESLQVKHKVKPNGFA